MGLEVHCLSRAIGGLFTSFSSVKSCLLHITTAEVGLCVAALKQSHSSAFPSNKSEGKKCIHASYNADLNESKLKMLCGIGEWENASFPG